MSKRKNLVVCYPISEYRYVFFKIIWSVLFVLSYLDRIVNSAIGCIQRRLALSIIGTLGKTFT